MEIASGQTRFVLLFKYFVVKIPKIYLFSWIHHIYYMIFKHFIPLLLRDKGEYLKRRREIRKKRPEELKEGRKRTEKNFKLKLPKVARFEMYGTSAMMLFAGIMANWQERCFYKKSKHIFLMPTYFSLFGLINIQKRGGKITFWNSDNYGMWRYIMENSQDDHQPFVDGHTLAESENFCLDGSHLKIVDYGNRWVEPYIMINGDALYNNFKIPV